MIGRRLRQLREDRGWAQVDLQAHLDDHVSQAALSMYETGKALPSISTLAQLADAFEVPVASLVLDPAASEREGVALAVLDAPLSVLARVKKALLAR